MATIWNTFVISWSSGSYFSRLSSSESRATDYQRIFMTVSILSCPVLVVSTALWRVSKNILSSSIRLVLTGPFPPGNGWISLLESLRRFDSILLAMPSMISLSSCTKGFFKKETSPTCQKRKKTIYCLPWYLFVGIIVFNFRGIIILLSFLCKSKKVTKSFPLYLFFLAINSK